MCVGRIQNRWYISLAFNEDVIECKIDLSCVSLREQFLEGTREATDDYGNEPVAENRTV